MRNYSLKDSVLGYLGIPSDRTDLFIMLEVIVAIVAISLLITIIQAIRQKSSAQYFGVVFVVSLTTLGIFVYVMLSNEAPSAAQIAARKNAGSEETSESIDLNVGFPEIYREYKDNELRADDLYKNNRYRITAKVNGMSTGGLLNLTGGATLTMETRVNNTIVFFYAEFEKDQEENLKTINVGDTITYEGECLSAGSWVDCELIMDE